MKIFNNAHRRVLAALAGLKTILKIPGFLLLAGLIILIMQPAQAAPIRWLTLVSLTFDDGLTESAARGLLAAHNMHGTFYVNSDLIGSGGTYLTKAELDSLHADGNEIGVHTLGHVNLATLSDAAQKSAICGDLQNLLNWGYPVYSMAYPYSSTGPTTQSLVATGCPGVGSLESARAVGGLKMPNQCYGCPWAESLPPRNPYYLISTNSITSSNTLADLQNYVIQAEQNGGGWVAIVFHRICEGCSELAVSETTLDAFLNWLATRESLGTYVRTVHEVMSGDYPAPPPPPQLGPNLIINPSLETDTDSDGRPDCWLQNHYGVNTPTWTRTTDAHTGTAAQQLSVTAYTSGDSKLLINLDGGQGAGGCAPVVNPGVMYQFKVWYKSTVSATLVGFYLDATGVWRYWISAPQLSASASWSQVVFYPGEIPPGAQALSFGVALSQTGTLITDDYSLAAILDTTPPDDTVFPIITEQLPANGTTVSGTVPLTIVATDNIAIQRVEFLINDAVVNTDTNYPYSFSWNSLAVANGLVNYTVRVTDFAGNVTNSAVTQLTVDNDRLAPTITFDQPPSPANNSSVSGAITLQATAADDRGIAKVNFLANGTLVGTATAAPYMVNWNSLANPDGPVLLTAMAYDAAGNSTVTPGVTVTVNNFAGNLLSNPSLEIDANNDAVADCWQRGGYGSNAYTWTRLIGVGTAHSGTVAQSLQITSRTTGDRKLVPRQDLSNCAPSVTAGTRYSLSVWYQSTIPTGIVVYYRNSAGAWQYWLTSPPVPASTVWAKAAYTTLPVPTSATALSFGVALSNVGSLVTDDYAMTVAP